MILKELDFKSEVQDSHYFAELKKEGFPTKKSEDYRHISLRDMLERKLSIDANRENNLYKDYISDEFYSLVFIDQAFDLEHSNLPSDISFTSSSKDKNGVKKDLSLLSEAFYEKDNILSISKSLDKPIMIINVSSGVDKFFANNLHIKVEGESEVDILEIFVSPENTANVYCINRDFFIENSKLNYAKLNLSSNQDILNINNTIYINKGECTLNAIERGSKQSINNYNVSLDEEFSSINMHGIIEIKDKQNISNTIKIHHNKKNTSSNQTFKQILDNNSRAVFNSQITINKNCSYSKAHQSSQTILLNDEARMFNEPRMMIFTDELEASHGATVGSLNEEAINYMKLRGLSLAECEKMLIKAFLTEIYDYVKNPVIKDYIDSHISRISI